MKINQRENTKLLDASTGLMECQVCRAKWFAIIKPQSGGKYYRNSWQCSNDCNTRIKADKEVKRWVKCIKQDFEEQSIFVRNKSYQRSLDFICNLCNGLNFQRDLADVLKDKEKWYEPNQCQNCTENHPDCDALKMGMIYISDDGAKHLPSEVELKGNSISTLKKAGKVA